MNTLFRENIEKMQGYTPGFQPKDPSAIKLNTNENPYPPSPKVFEAIARLDGQALRKYPPILWDSFRRTAAKVHGVEPEMVVCGNGADELLSILVRCCCDKDRPLAYPVPTYSLYPILARIQDCPVIELPWGGDYRLPPKLGKTKAALTFLCNPNAPTGTFVPVEEVKKLADEISGVLAVDEAYVDFAEDNCLRLVREYENVVVLRSMSKGYSLAGLRFGYAIAGQRIVEAMIKVKDSYNVNAVTQAAAIAALEDQAYFLANVQKIIAQRARLITGLRELGFQAGPSQTNFVLAQIDRPRAEEIYQKLVERAIFVRYFGYKGLEDKLRISVGAPQENEALLSALQDIIKKER